MLLGEVGEGLLLLGILILLLPLLLHLPPLLLFLQGKPHTFEPSTDFRSVHHNRRVCDKPILMVSDYHNDFSILATLCEVICHLSLKIKYK